MSEAYERPLCPACNNPLVHSIEVREGGQSRHVIFCKVGRCPSYAANTGAEAATLGEALVKLEAAIEDEVDQPTRLH